MKAQLPLLSAVVVPIESPLANTSTKDPASAVPMKLGVLSLVRLSVAEIPESAKAISSGVVGAPGGTLSSG